MHKRKVKDQAAPAARAADDDFNFELQENVAYATTPHNKQMSEGCCVMEEKEEEEERSEEINTSVKGNTVPLEPTIPKLPVRQYLLEKEVRVVQTMQLLPWQLTSKRYYRSIIVLPVTHLHVYTQMHAQTTTGLSQTPSTCCIYNIILNSV